jgi:extracellular elastinolytic metalloproteinase
LFFKIFFTFTPCFKSLNPIHYINLLHIIILYLKLLLHMKRLFQKLSMSLFALTLLSNVLLAQNAEQLKQPHPDAVNIALRFLEKQQSAWNLTAEDVKNVRVQDYYSTEANGVTHVFILQENAHIELYNGLVNVNVLPSGEILFAGNRFMHDFASTVNATQPRLTPEVAIRTACEVLKVKYTEGSPLKQVLSKTEFIFDKGTSVLSDINVKLKYQRMSDNSARLAWDLNIDQPDGQNHWTVRIDALTGEMLDKGSYTLHCKLEKDHFAHAKTDCADENSAYTEGSRNNRENSSVFQKQTLGAKTASAATVIGGGSYRVFALPTESPSHGNRTLVVDPADSLASPFGWHDVNGVVGAEYQITRGNNVWAYLDLTNTDASSGDEPNGGATLAFDPFYSPTIVADSLQKAATVNLFYVNNMVHDITARYGFDEASGNFQANNYSGNAAGNDAVKAQAQDSYGLTAATAGRNNANFSTPPDGGAPRMQMYIWDDAAAETKLLHVKAPTALISDVVTFAAYPNFGAQITATPVTGDAVFVNDGSGSPTLGCGTIQNNLTGKIALIDRGTCEFGAKALKAQQKGAIGVVICFFDDNLAGMAAGASGANVTIPVVAIKKSDADKMRAAAAAGTLKLSLYEAVAPLPPNLDGDFDNGIIIHEYMHGISNRLTGGRNNTNCLGNAEQGGEGWSDFLALALTARPGDRGITNRGVGTFVIRQPITAEGIRNAPYSTDLNVSTQNYSELPFTASTTAVKATNAEVHSTGEVWCAALWEMYWGMSDKYGWDANWKNVNSGNGKAIRLVMDGMKMQPCSPGFLDARDAILAADRADFNGDNQCLIWEAFARRGMGYNAKQGLSTSTADNVSSEEKNPYCVKALKITKTAPDFIKAGEQITYTIQVINHKGIAATSVVVTDEMPQFTTLVAGSASRAVTQAGQNLSFAIGAMNNNDTVTITYKVATDPTKKSIVQFADDFERGDINWDPVSLKNSTVFWDIQGLYVRGGTKAYGIGYAQTAASGAVDQATQLLNPVTIRGTKPILNFFQRFNTEPRYDAAILQITTNNGTTWDDLGDKIFKSPYSGKIIYSLFAIPNQRGWSGLVNKYTPVSVDLSSYVGQSVKFRYRFGTDTTDMREGWFIDDVSVMDMFNYDTRVRLSSAQGDTASAGVIGRGTIVDGATTPTTEITEGSYLHVFPNPANDLLNISILVNKPTREADVSIVSVDGRVMWQQKTTFNGSKELLLPVNMAEFASGIYFVKVRTDEKTLVEKVVKR